MSKEEKSNKKPYTVMLAEDDLEEIEPLASKLGVSRSLLMRNLLLIGLEEFKNFENWDFYRSGLLNSEVFYKMHELLTKEGAESIFSNKDEK